MRGELTGPPALRPAEPAAYRTLLILQGPVAWFWLALLLRDNSLVLSAVLLFLTLGYLLSFSWAFWKAGIEARLAQAVVVVCLALLVGSFALLYLAKVVEWAPLGRFIMRRWPEFYP